MKIRNILFALLATIAVASCSPTPTNKKTDIPVEVVKLKEIKKFDTLLVVNAEKQIYQFDYKTTDYVTTIDKTKDENSPVFLGMFFGAILTLVFVAIVAIAAGSR